MLKPVNNYKYVEGVGWVLLKPCASHQETGEYCKDCGEQVIAANPELTSSIFWSPTARSC